MKTYFFVDLVSFCGRKVSEDSGYQFQMRRAPVHILCDVIVVGADGKLNDDEWRRSNCFRIVNPLAPLYSGYVLQLVLF